MGPMSSEPAVLGIAIGGAIFVLTLVPMLVWQSLRFGAVTFRRVLGAGALAVYGAALACYTLLPSSPIDTDLTTWCAAHGYDGINLDPMTGVRDVTTATAGLPLSAALMTPAVLQLALNVLLFVPWGVLARGYLGWGRLVSVASACCCSAIVETTQATGVFGLIPCSYRFGDVDDLITNTLGGAIGVLLAPLVLGWMPKARELARMRGLPRPVTLRRRWSGMAVDWLIFVLLGFVLYLGQRLVVLTLYGGPVPEPGGESVLLGGAIPFVVVFVVPAFLGSGASWGQRVVWLEPDFSRRRRTGGAGLPGQAPSSTPAPNAVPPSAVGESSRPAVAPVAGEVSRRVTSATGEISPSAVAPTPGEEPLPGRRVSLVRRLIRATIPGGAWGVLGVLDTVPGSDGLSQYVLGIGFLAVVSILVTPDRRGLSGLVSRCRYVDARQGRPGAERPQAGRSQDHAAPVPAAPSQSS